MQIDLEQRNTWFHPNSKQCKDTEITYSKHCNHTRMPKKRGEGKMHVVVEETKRSPRCQSVNDVSTRADHTRQWTNIATMRGSGEINGIEHRIGEEVGCIRWWGGEWRSLASWVVGQCVFEWGEIRMSKLRRQFKPSSGLGLDERPGVTIASLRRHYTPDEHKD